MPEQADTNRLFPKFEQFVLDKDLVSKAKGSLAAKLPRIMGQGKTKADGLNLPPSAIERKLELLSLTRSGKVEIPVEIKLEIDQVEQEVESALEKLKTTEGIRDLAIQVLRRLPGQTGQKDNQYFAGRLVLIPRHRGQAWAWSITPYYPIIDKIPPDVEYLEKAYSAAEQILERIILPVEVFENRLLLAWAMARHFSETDNVLVIDIARMFKIACQEERFWNNPQKRFFTDAPEAAFIANLLNWRMHKGQSKIVFEFVRATLHQAHGTKAKVFYMPQNPEGTQVTPVIYLKRLS